MARDAKARAIGEFEDRSSEPTTKRAPGERRKGLTLGEYLNRMILDLNELENEAEAEAEAPWDHDFEQLESLFEEDTKTDALLEELGNKIETARKGYKIIDQHLILVGRFWEKREEIFEEDAENNAIEVINVALLELPKIFKNRETFSTVIHIYEKSCHDKFHPNIILGIALIDKVNEELVFHCDFIVRFLDFIEEADFSREKITRLRGELEFDFTSEEHLARSAQVAFEASAEPGSNMELAAKSFARAHFAAIAAKKREESGLKLPEKGEIPTWPERDKSKPESRDPISFLRHHWQKYIDAELLYQPFLRRYDGKLVAAIHSYCNNRADDPLTPDALSVLPPPQDIETERHALDPAQDEVERAKSVIALASRTLRAQ